MALSSLSVALNFASIASGIVPETHTPGNQSARTLGSIGADLGLAEVLNYDSANSDVNTTPKAVAVLRQTVTIPGGGTYTLDLSAAAIEGATSGGARALTEDLNGKKLLGFVIATGVMTRNANSTTWAANAGGVMTIKPNGTNGYPLFGASITQGVKLGVRDYMARYDTGDDGTTINNATAYKIDFTGTSGDKAEILMLFS